MEQRQTIDQRSSKKINMETIVYCKSSKEYFYYIFRDNGEEVEFKIQDNTLSSSKRLTDIEVKKKKKNLLK